MQRTVNCPHCREVVPALDDCVQCGRPMGRVEAAGGRSQPQPFGAPPAIGGRPLPTQGVLGSEVGLSAPPTPEVRQPPQESKAVFVVMFLLVTLLFGLTGIHVVVGGRFGAHHKVLFKESLSFLDTFVDLDSMDPGNGYYRNFRESHPSLNQVVRSALVQQLHLEGFEGRPTVSSDSKDMKKCRAVQLILEGARRFHFFETGKELTNVGEPAFFAQLVEAGLLVKAPNHPGSGEDSSAIFTFDARLGQVACKRHGSVGRDAAGEFWDLLDYQLIFKTDPMPELGGIAGLPDLYSPLLEEQQARTDCMSKLASVAHAVQAYNTKYLAGTLTQSLDIRTLRDMVAKGIVAEIPQCPKGQGRFVYEVRGYAGEVPKVFCSRHVHEFP